MDLRSFGGRFGVDLGSIWMDLGSIWVDLLNFYYLFWMSRFDAKVMCHKCPKRFSNTRLP